MASTPPGAFLSYTRFDDKHDGGAISQFRLRLASAVRAVTGEPFEIFQDVDGIGLGERWSGKLDEMLEEARFFIPIVTPSYFKSQACRAELEKFLRAEADRGRDDLVLPIYYIESDVLEEDDLRTADSLAKILHQRQRQDWRELRFEPFDAKEVRRALERLAREIVRARRRSLPGPPVPPMPVEADRSAAHLKPKPAAAPSDRLAGGVPRPVKRLEAGRIFREIDAPWCPEMAVIASGEFMMGSTELERQWAIGQGAERESVEWEKPQHLVRIAYPLAVGCYPVTFDEYEHFTRATGYRQPSGEGWGRGRRPVINVSWNDARAYVKWLASETARAYRLLSEAEWEYACRAGTATRFWWGDEVSRHNANYYGAKVGKTSEVGSYPANPWGLYDMHGNVNEWVEDCWNDSYTGAPNNGSAWTSGDCSLRVLRGGSCFANPRNLRSAYRDSHYYDVRHGYFGFRVARTLP